MYLFASYRLSQANVPPRNNEAHQRCFVFNFRSFVFQFLEKSQLIDRILEKAVRCARNLKKKKKMTPGEFYSSSKFFYFFVTNAVNSGSFFPLKHYASSIRATGIFFIRLLSEIVGFIDRSIDRSILMQIGPI